MKKCLLSAAALASAAAMAMPRVVENPTLHRLASSPKVTVTYSLTVAPAIVTMDVQTNYFVDAEERWASIGGENITSGDGALEGEIYKMVSGTGPYTIVWHPEKSWPGPSGVDPRTVNPQSDTVRIVITAWPTNDPPPYMVVDLASGAKTFYPGEDFLPGGLLANEAYRKTSLVMRKIEARDVTWMMGSIGDYGRDVGTNDETTRSVTLTNDYYMGVFPVTQRQYAEIAQECTGRTIDSNDITNWPSAFSLASCRDMRPAEMLSYVYIRFDMEGDYNETKITENEWPKPPCAKTFPGVLKTKTGLVFDLPTEEQWEFAARAGHCEGEWGDGSAYELDGSAAKNAACAIGRNGNNVSNSGITGHEGDYDATRGTAICGSYPPNSWGLYDMHGNVREWTVDTYDCLEFNEKFDLTGDKAITPSTDIGTHNNDIKCVRGGNWNSPAYRMRAADRSNFEKIQTGKANLGFRVICPTVMPAN